MLAKSAALRYKFAPKVRYVHLKYSADFLSATYGNHNHLAGYMKMAIPLLQIEEKYNWDRIAQQTIQVYRKALVHGAKRKGQRGKGR